MSSEDQIDNQRYPVLTPQDLGAILPPHLRSSATQELADLVNNVSNDPEVAEGIRNNFISYTNVLKEGKFKAEDYLNAVSYVSYKLMGYNNMESYARAFPQRYQALRAKGTSDKDISAYVAAYHKGRLVNLVMEQSLVPTWVLNQDVYQQAINEQARLMLNAKSEKVRSDAANSLLTHLKRPEKKEFQLNLGFAETSGMGELKDMLSNLATKQKEMIDGGVTTKEIAHQKMHKDVIDITPEEETP